METRARRYERSKPQCAEASTSSVSQPPCTPAQQPQPWVQAPASNACNGANSIHWPLINRPLSDIRELSEPSMSDNHLRQPNILPRHRHSRSRSSSVQRNHSVKRVGSNRSVKLVPGMHKRSESQEQGSSSYSTTPEPPSIYSIPQASIPRRSSSQKRTHRPGKLNQKLRARSPYTAAVPPAPKYAIPHYEPQHSQRPDAGTWADPMMTGGPYRNPLHLLARVSPSTEALDFPAHKHPRIKVEAQVSAPIFVGGGSIEGHVRLTVDATDCVRHRRSLSIGRTSVELFGFEEVLSDRRAIFIALGTELIDEKHPPPPNMVEAIHPWFSDDHFWPLATSTTLLPFTINLPLDTGPPPFHSKHASIRFLLVVTAALRDAGKLYRVRTSQDVQVLPTYDPEKALTSLPSPLTACDEVRAHRGTGHDRLRIMAGLHRQVWVSGSSIFVDVNISNSSRKPVRRLELALERDVLCYKHTAAATLEKSASQARIFGSNEQTIVVKSTYKPGALGWDGVDPHTSNFRTCELLLPRGHATVRCGKYFEVRYFLNVTAALSKSAQVSVQLPIILIHINSLDVVPNSVAQVAAAIEEKRADLQRKRSRSRKQSRTHSRPRSPSSNRGTNPRGMEPRRRPSYGQGRAFAAPRQQSLDRQREQQADIDELRCVIDTSPTKRVQPSGANITMMKPASNLSLRSLGAETQGANNSVAGDVNPRPPLPPPPPPPPPPDARFNVSAPGPRGEGISLRSRLRSMRSFDVFRRKDSVGKSLAAQAENRLPPGSRSASQQSSHQLMPHTLGLKTVHREARPKMSFDILDTEQQPIAAEPREPLGQFEFKAASTKANGGVHETRMNWWEQRRNHWEKGKERVAWI